jgi:hypothetical protein
MSYPHARCKLNNQKPKTPADVRGLAKSHSDRAIRVLAAIARQEKCPPAARCMAAQALLNRGWGRPSQAITSEDGGELQITNSAAGRACFE